MDLHGFFGLTLLQDPCACRQLLEGKFLYVHSYWKLGLQSPELNVSKGSMEWSISGRKWQPTSIPRAWKWLDIKQYVAWPTWRVEILYELPSCSHQLMQGSFEPCLVNALEVFMIWPNYSTCWSLNLVKAQRSQSFWHSHHTLLWIEKLHHSAWNSVNWTYWYTPPVH